MLTSPTIQSDSNAAASAPASLGPGSPIRAEQLRPVPDFHARSPQTPRRLMPAACAPPPVLQHRRWSSPPSKASHPVLAVAFTDTGKASPAQQRKPPTRRQLEPAFARASSLPDPTPTASFLPQEAAAQLLSHQIRSLPNPLKAQQVLANKAGVSNLAQRTPSTILATLLQHTTPDASNDNGSSFTRDQGSLADPAGTSALLYQGPVLPSVSLLSTPAAAATLAPHVSPPVSVRPKPAAAAFHDQPISSPVSACLKPQADASHQVLSPVCLRAKPDAAAPHDQHLLSPVALRLKPNEATTPCPLTPLSLPCVPLCPSISCLRPPTGKAQEIDQSPRLEQPSQRDWMHAVLRQKPMLEAFAPDGSGQIGKASFSKACFGNNHCSVSRLGRDDACKDGFGNNSLDQHNCGQGSSGMNISSQHGSSSDGYGRNRDGKDDQHPGKLPAGSLWSSSPFAWQPLHRDSFAAFQSGLKHDGLAQIDFGQDSCCTDGVQNDPCNHPESKPYKDSSVCDSLPRDSKDSVGKHQSSQHSFSVHSLSQDGFSKLQSIDESSKRDSVSRDGFCSLQPRPEAFSKEGFGMPQSSKEGFSTNSFGKHHFSKDSFSKDGFSQLQSIKEGLSQSKVGKHQSSRDGASRDVFSKDGFSTDGYTKDGYSKDGYGKDGFSTDGYSKDGYGKDGYGKDGYSKDGFSKDGFSKDRYSKDGFSKGRLSKVVPLTDWSAELGPPRDTSPDDVPKRHSLSDLRRHIVDGIVPYTPRSIMGRAHHLDRLQDRALALLQPDLPSAGAPHPHPVASAFPMTAPLPHGKKRSRRGSHNSSDSHSVDSHQPSKLPPSRQLSLPAYRHTSRPSPAVRTPSPGNPTWHDDALQQLLSDDFDQLPQHRRSNSSLITNHPQLHSSNPLPLAFWDRYGSNDSRPQQQRASADLDNSGSDGSSRRARHEPKEPRPLKLLRAKANVTTDYSSDSHSN